MRRCSKDTLKWYLNKGILSVSQLIIHATENGYPSIWSAIFDGEKTATEVYSGIETLRNAYKKREKALTAFNKYLEQNLNSEFIDVENEKSITVLKSLLPYDKTCSRVENQILKLQLKAKAYLPGEALKKTLGEFHNNHSAISITISAGLFNNNQLHIIYKKYGDIVAIEITQQLIKNNPSAVELLIVIEKFNTIEIGDEVCEKLYERLWQISNPKELKSLLEIK